MAEDKQWVQYKNFYPILKNDPTLVELTLDSKGVFQTDKNSYPVYPHLESLIPVLTEPLPAGIFTLNPESDYPYPLLPHLESLIPVLTKPLPAGIFQIEDSYPIFPHTESLIPVLTRPYPSGIFIDNEETEYPFMDHINTLIPILTKPYPAGIFISDSEEQYPFMAHLNLVPIGICYYTENLEEVEIPSTMEAISDYSFLKTSIVEVVLPENCLFYKTSFPEDIKIIKN